MFRLSRIEGDVLADGRPGSFTVPAGTDVRALTTGLTPVRPTIGATVLARKGSAVFLRRRALTVTEDVAGPDTETPWDRLEVSTYSHNDLASDVLGHLGEVVAVEPPELRDLVVARLADLAGGAR